MYKDQIEKVKSNYNNLIGQRDALNHCIVLDNKTISILDAQVAECNCILALLNTVSNEAREKARVQLETVVTEALQYVSGESYKFRIEMLNRGKPSCEFYVVSDFNGIESVQKPQDGCGGGFVDIITTTLRYVYLNAFNSPVINNAAILDEPGKMVDEMSSIKFSEFIKFLGKTFDRQTIMVTHNDTLLNAADKNCLVTNVNGVSIVNDNTYDITGLEDLLDV